ncbi:probable E3 ubiquitin-protein ligase TRIML1 [Dromiciops gliroides]|uniref:probable E3 ubiquitin-protein ligase TRIML1 n=1 Tax=Dromiciops gliroides TaxID=33562 RepID=UPI001CC5C0E2|nr:probable E3 ubiquitin-protein ligase TRIML1 [Dromiciops gliroides]
MDDVTLVQSFQNETTCSICLTFFSKPVTLNCGHSFCQFCLTRSKKDWDTNFICPECRTVSQNIPVFNVCLSKLSAICKKLNPQNSQNPVGQSSCQKHQQVPKLFCKEDQTSLCIACTNGQEHAAHTFSPIEEAAQDRRKKLQNTMPLLRKKIKEFKALKTSKKERRVKWKKLIRAEYEKMHQLLFEEENYYMKKIIGDEKIESQLRDNYYNQHVKNMEDTIGEIDATRGIPDLDLLEESKELLQMSESLLCEKPKSFTSELRKYPITGMKELLKHYAVNVTMEPTTASDYVIVSEDLKSVRHRDDCPDQSNRSEKFPYFVFGQQAFSYGKCYWEVDVSEQPQWALGIATRSLRKTKRTQNFVVRPYILCCEKKGNDFYLINRPGLVQQQMKDPVSVIGIYLDFSSRALLFYNAIEASLIYGIYTVPVTEPIRPLFSPCPPMPGTRIGSMTICTTVEETE